MPVFVHALGIKTVHAGGGVYKWQNSVHIVFECPLASLFPTGVDNEKVGVDNEKAFKLF
jgi:hypothetical protein